MSDKSYIVTTEKNPNPNFIPPPSTTGSNTVNPTVGIKCPYRPVYYPQIHKVGEWYITSLAHATKIEVKFQDCIGKDCACWTPIGCKK